MTYNQLSKFYNVRDEISVWNDVCVARGSREIKQTKLRKTILDLAHEGHLGMVRIKQTCRETVWWLGINQNIEEIPQLNGKDSVNGDKEQKNATLRKTENTATRIRQEQRKLKEKVDTEQNAKKYTLNEGDLVRIRLPVRKKQVESKII